MKTTIEETYTFYNTLARELAICPTDPMVAYKFFKFAKAADKIVQESDEFLSKYRYEKNGLSEEEKKKKESLFQKAWNELKVKEVELPDLKFKLSELAGTKLSMSFMYVFEEFIEE